MMGLQTATSSKQTQINQGGKSLRIHINFQTLKSFMVHLKCPVAELGVVRGNDSGSSKPDELVQG